MVAFRAAIPVVYGSYAGLRSFGTCAVALRMPHAVSSVIRGFTMLSRGDFYLISWYTCTKNVVIVCV